jgi:hypothetical protein
MKKHSKQLALRGDSKPALSLTSLNLGDVCAGAGASITPSGAPATMSANPSSNTNG